MSAIHRYSKQVQKGVLYKWYYFHRVVTNGFVYEYDISYGPVQITCFHQTVRRKVDVRVDHKPVSTHVRFPRGLSNGHHITRIIEILYTHTTRPTDPYGRVYMLTKLHFERTAGGVRRSRFMRIVNMRTVTVNHRRRSIDRTPTDYLSIYTYIVLSAAGQLRHLRYGGVVYSTYTFSSIRLCFLYAELVVQVFTILHILQSFRVARIQSI